MILTGSGAGSRREQRRCVFHTFQPLDMIWLVAPALGAARAHPAVVARSDGHAGGTRHPAITLVRDARGTVVASRRPRLRR